MNATDKTYNGWTNYETWNVKLWMDNDEGDCNHWQGAAQEAYDEAEASSTFTREEQATLDLSHILKAEYEEGAPDLGACSYSDLLNAAISEVNWHEIAESLMNDVDKDDEETEE